FSNIRDRCGRRGDSRRGMIVGAHRDTGRSWHARRGSGREGGSGAGKRRHSIVRHDEPKDVSTNGSRSETWRCGVGGIQRGSRAGYLEAFVTKRCSRGVVVVRSGAVEVDRTAADYVEALIGPGIGGGRHIRIRSNSWNKKERLCETARTVPYRVEQNLV